VHCGLGCFQPQPPSELLGQIYNEEYFHWGYLSVQQRYRKFIPKILRGRLAPYVRPGARVLDVGAGPGFWMEAVQALGCHVEGMEPSDAARRLLRKRFTVAADWDGVNGDWDAILVMDVLGSIPNPGDTLDKIAERLRPGGLLIIRYPNFQGCWRRCDIWRAYLKNESPFGLPDVLWHFEPRHMARWLPSKGLRVVRQYLEIQPWARGGGKTRMLRWLCAGCDFLVRGGDEHYTIAMKPIAASL
jgi:SAM-dependent methyltransferase